MAEPTNRTPDKEALEWIYLRLKKFHGDRPCNTFMKKLKAIAERTKPTKVTLFKQGD